MKLLSDDYKAQLRRLHNDDPMWGASAVRWRQDVLDLAAETESRTILDYGCGKGQLKITTEKFGAIDSVREYDPGIPGKDSPPVPADMVACLDVIEHLEPECLNTVLEHIASLAEKCAFLVIALYPSNTKLPDGRDSHLIIESPTWWTERLYQVFTPDRWEMTVEHRSRPCRRQRVKDVVAVRLIKKGAA